MICMSSFKSQACILFESSHRALSEIVDECISKMSFNQVFSSQTV